MDDREDSAGNKIVDSVTTTGMHVEPLTDDELHRHHTIKPDWDHVVCSCGWIKTGDADIWKLAARKWFPGLLEAREYRDNPQARGYENTIRTLQAQVEKGREDVAHWKREKAKMHQGFLIEQEKAEKAEARVKALEASEQALSDEVAALINEREYLLEKARHKPDHDMLSIPEWLEIHNACTDRCDCLYFPCACKSKHDWDWFLGEVKKVLDNFEAENKRLREALEDSNGLLKACLHDVEDGGYEQIEAQITENRAALVTTAPKRSE